jgi:hypothetical protein
MLRPGKTPEEKPARKVIKVFEGTPETNVLLKENKIGYKLVVVNRCVYLD